MRRGRHKTLEPWNPGTNGRNPGTHPETYTCFGTCCCRSVLGINTTLSRYSQLTSIAQIKDAIMNYGAVAIGVMADVSINGWKPSHLPGQTSTYPSSLGVGLSCTAAESNGRSNHLVNLVGWGPCNVGGKVMMVV